MADCRALVLGFLLLSLLASPAQAFRCGTRIVVSGDSKPLVHDKCGEPEYTEVIREGYRSRNYIREERWYYPKRPGRQRPVVIFGDDGKVYEIRMER